MPEAAIATYLVAVLEEANIRGYHFDGSKILKKRVRDSIIETDGQIIYEWQHLKRKLQKRDKQKYLQLKSAEVPDCHPLFRIVPGKVREWERVK